MAAGGIGFRPSLPGMAHGPGRLFHGSSTAWGLPEYLVHFHKCVIEYCLTQCMVPNCSSQHLFSDDRVASPRPCKNLTATEHSQW